jgi:hypothetical protein
VEGADHVIGRRNRYISREAGSITLWRGIIALECVKHLLFPEEKGDQTGAHDVQPFSVSRLAYD